MFGIWQSIASEPAPDVKTVREVVIIPVSGEVGPAMAAFIDRALHENAGTSDTLFVLEMDTFGGRVDSAFQIVDSLLAVTRERTLAFIKKKAISAGALIALACDGLVMVPSTTIGDCAPIIISNEGPRMLGEKFQSPLRAKFRTLARRNGYPEVLAESMVSPDMEVYEVKMGNDKVVYISGTDYDDLTEREMRKIRSKKTVVGEGKLLTMDDREALEFGFSQMSTGSVEDMLREKGITDYQIRRHEENWSEQMVRLITAIAPILMLIGFAGLYIEMQTPGFGVPGIMGIICISLVFLSQHMVGLADHTELLLLTIGIVFLGVEMFVFPGFGVAGIVGILLIVAGMVLSFQDFVIPDPEIPWEMELLEKNMITVLGSLLGAVLLILLFLRYVFPKMSQMIAGPYLSATLAESRVGTGAVIPVSAGDRGVVIKPLRPSGSVGIGDETYDVVSEGEFVDRGQTVIVIQVRGNRIVVAGSVSDDNEN